MHLAKRAVFYRRSTLRFWQIPRHPDFRLDRDRSVDRIGNEIRFIKQSYQLEDIRLLEYERLRNLVMLVLATAYFASVHLGKRAKLGILIQHVQQAAK